MAPAALRLLLLPAVLAALAAAKAAAQDCTGPQTQMEMTDCAGRAYRVADDALNAEYRRAAAALDRGGAAALREAQRAWIDFRDRACEVEGMQYQGGSIQPMIVADCLARLTLRRTEDLRLLSEGG